MLMKLKKAILRILGVYDYDRVGEARVLKAIRLYRAGGKINNHAGLEALQ